MTSTITDELRAKWRRQLAFVFTFGPIGYSHSWVNKCVGWRRVFWRLWVRL